MRIRSNSSNVLLFCMLKISEFLKSRTIRISSLSCVPSISLHLFPKIVAVIKEYEIGDTNTNEAVEAMRRQLPPSESIREIQSIPTEFEKDDDSNHHIDFIAACANLRAEKWRSFF